MSFNYDSLTRHVFPETRQRYSAKDSALYALSLGIGADPLDPQQLRYVYEQDQQALPTMAVVLGHPGFWAGNPALGIDWKRMLHVGQGLTVIRPLAVSGEVVTTSRIADVIDRGADRGALVYYERDVMDANSGALLATVRQTLLCRGNGGFGGSARSQPAQTVLPQRPPDLVDDTHILPQAALLYRLSGDFNPLHADPAVAIQAGFPRPILHGLATYGMAGAVLVRQLIDCKTSRLGSFDVRFTAPVFPGETLRTECWIEPEGILLRTSVLERDLVVLDAGRAEIVPIVAGAQEDSLATVQAS